MQEQSNEAYLRQLAAEVILGTSGLTDNLTDEEAKPLIAWALNQAEAAVRSTMAAGQAVDMLPHDQLGALVAERMGPVRRVMKAIDGLTADRLGLSAGEVADELAYIQDLAQKLPSPPPKVPAPCPALAAADIAAGDLLARQAGLDNSTFVSTILSVLGGEPSTQQQEAEQLAKTGGNDDQTEEWKTAGSGPCWCGDRYCPVHPGSVSVASHRGAGFGPV